MKAVIRILFLVVLTACNNLNQTENNAIEVKQSTISKHMERLASNEFLGRMPFTEGETKTVNYLKEEFEKLGLMPGNGDSYFQEVPMVEITSFPSEKMTISSQTDNFTFNHLEDFVAVSFKTDSVVDLINSELVFAGYGIVAPEYNWNDYEGIDWTGKTAVVLVNDPGFKSGDSNLFKGKAMTYYGRWTYKYEEAARQGAAGVIIIHETEPASYGWNVVETGWYGAQLGLESEDPKVDVEGWITKQAAEKLFEASTIDNKNFPELAMNKDFKPVPMGLSVSLSIRNEIERNVSSNVLALIEGSSKKDECIIYSAHWDHLGVGKSVDGDSIYNGAIDNASGTACLLAIAEAFQKGPKPERSILFMAVTAEEQGLLGSGYYAENPVFLPEKTVANINMDGLQSPGPMKDLTIIGYGHSELDEYAEKVAEKYGRYIISDPKPENGYFYRSDHFNFAKIGVPALYASGSYEDFEHGPGYVKQKNDEYNENKYHQLFDEFDPATVELRGIRFDAQLLFEVGLKLANEDYFPKWKEGSEFKAIRENN